MELTLFNTTYQELGRSTRHLTYVQTFQMTE